MKESIEKNISDTVLDVPFDIPIDVEELKLSHRIGLRMWKRKKKVVFSIKRIRLASLYKISTILLDIPDVDDLEKMSMLRAGTLLMSKSSDQLLDIVTIAFHNKNSNPPKWLKSFLNSNLDAKDLKNVSELIVSKMNVMDFIYTIITWKGVSLLKKGESIALGGPSEISKNISDTTGNTSFGEPVSPIS
jgi:hypothetical protein